MAQNDQRYVTIGIRAEVLSTCSVVFLIAGWLSYRKINGIAGPRPGSLLQSEINTRDSTWIIVGNHKSNTLPVNISSAHTPVIHSKVTRNIVQDVRGGKRDEGTEVLRRGHKLANCYT